MSCQTLNKDNKLEVVNYTFEYDHQGPITAKFHQDFLDSLEHGFCIFGPIDMELRVQRLHEQFQEFLRRHPDFDLDKLQGVEHPSAPLKLKKK